MTQEKAIQEAKRKQLEIAIKMIGVVAHKISDEFTEDDDVSGGFLGKPSPTNNPNHP